MDENQKKKLCSQACHPGNGVPSKKGGWEFDENSEWNAFSKKIFVGPLKNISYNWVPLHVFPFFQGKNYLEDEPKLLPMPAMNPLMIRFLFHENKSFIFKKKDGNKNLYRFSFTDFNLCYEKIKLSQHTHKMLMSHKILEFPGVTRLTRRANINAGDTTYNAIIQQVPFPESVYIFAVPKEVPNGSFEYTNSTSDVFLPHRITSVKFAYGNLNYFTETPDIGMITKTAIEYKILSDYRDYPPFGR